MILNVCYFVAFVAGLDNTFSFGWRSRRKKLSIYIYTVWCCVVMYCRLYQIRRTSHSAPFLFMGRSWDWAETHNIYVPHRYTQRTGSGSLSLSLCVTIFILILFLWCVYSWGTMCDDIYLKFFFVDEKNWNITNSNVLAKVVDKNEKKNEKKKYLIFLRYETHLNEWKICLNYFRR